MPSTSPMAQPVRQWRVAATAVDHVESCIEPCSSWWCSCSLMPLSNLCTPRGYSELGGKVLSEPRVTLDPMAEQSGPAAGADDVLGRFSPATSAWFTGA